MSSVYGGPMGARDDDDYNNQDECTNLIMEKIRAIEALNISKETIHQYCHMILTGLNMVNEMIQPVRNDVEQLKREKAKAKPAHALTLFQDAYDELSGTRYNFAARACNNMIRWLKGFGELNVDAMRLAMLWEDYLTYEKHIYEWREPEECDMEDFAEWLSEQEL